MSNSPPLPNEREPFANWLATQLDADRTLHTGPRWRSKLLGGRTLNDLLAERQPHRKVNLQVRVDELSVLTKAVLASGLSRHAFIRRCVGHYLIHHCDIDRDTIPDLARDVP